MSKIFIGKVKKNFEHGYVAGEILFLHKHSWDCNWYYGFGYIGNEDLHTHFNSTFLQSTETADEIFENPLFTNNEWWIIRDLFIQAYALKKVAEVYRHGGYQTSKKGITDIITNKEKEKQINEDLKKVLDALWNFINDSIEGQQAIKDKKEKLEKEKEKLKEKEKQLKSELKNIEAQIKTI